MVLYVSLHTTDTTIITPYRKITTLLPFDTISFFCTTLLLMTYSYCILNAYLLIDNWNKFLLRFMRISTNKILHELFYSLFYEYQAKSIGRYNFQCLLQFEFTLPHIQLEDVYDPWHATLNNGHKKDSRIESMNVLYHKYTTASKIMGKLGWYS